MGEVSRRRPKPTVPISAIGGLHPDIRRDSAHPTSFVFFVPSPQRVAFGDFVVRKEGDQR